MRKTFLALLFIFLPLSTFAYPGCSFPDIIIGGQIWASCNAITNGKGSDSRSGWFHVAEKYPLFTSANDLSDLLTRSIKAKGIDRNMGPCARGYKLPTSGDWLTLMWYSRLNSLPITDLILLPRNGGYLLDKGGDGVTFPSPISDAVASYWTQDFDGYSPIILTLRYEPQMSYELGQSIMIIEPSLDLAVTNQMANVRCIRR